MHFQFVYACCIQSVLYILSAVGTGLTAQFRQGAAFVFLFILF